MNVRTIFDGPASAAATRLPSDAAAPLVITTSWDDGHPCDLQLADLLDRYGLPATFYVPRNSQRPTLDAHHVRGLSQRFELGAHTIDHMRLTTLPDAVARQQVAASKAWTEEVSGEACLMFCPPQGAFHRRHVRLFEELGFGGYRTVEMGALSRPRPIGNCLEMPTTLQAHPHAVSVYFRNAVRRRRLPALWLAMRHATAGSWVERARLLAAEAQALGGVFHLWGHSWEIDEHDQWEPLEQVLQMLAELVAAGLAAACTNGELCRSPAAAAGEGGAHVAG